MKSGGLKLDEILDIAIPLAEGLAEAHEAGVVHRDLKPGNVMLDGKGRVKILDFGLSHPLPESDLVTAGLTTTGTVMGTPHYMAPEQMRGEETDARSDLFSLGVILYELATGVRPFEGDSLAVVMNSVLQGEPTPILPVNPHLGELFAHIVERLLEKDPDARAQSAADVAAELRSLKKPSIGVSAAAPQRRRWTLPRLGAAVAGAVLLGLAIRGLIPNATPGDSARPILAIVPFSFDEGDEEASTIASILTYSLSEALDLPEIDLILARRARIGAEEVPLMQEPA